MSLLRKLSLSESSQSFARMVILCLKANLRMMVSPTRMPVPSARKESGSFPGAVPPHLAKILSSCSMTRPKDPAAFAAPPSGAIVISFYLNIVWQLT